MVTCSAVVDGRRWREGPAEEEELLQQAMSTTTSFISSARALVYDAETGSLRYSKPNLAAAAILSPKSPRSPACSFKLEFHDRLADVVSTDTPPCKQLHGDGFADSGESSPTCVIQNSALRSNSSSPTMSTISKASSDPGGRSTESKLQGVATRSPPELDEEVVDSGAPSPRLELHKIGDVRERVRVLESSNSTSGRSEPKGQMNTDSSMAKENAGWSIPPQYQSKDATQNPPFKSIQCAVAEVKSVEAGMKKSKQGRIPVARLADSSIIHCSQKTPGIFSFNATYMTSTANSDDQDSDDFSDHLVHSDTASTTPKSVVVVQQQQQQHQQQQQQQLDLCRRTYLAPLLKPTPSKWDDAEKWLPGSECHSARAKSRSGPLLAQLVAAQFGMSIPWKGPQLALPPQTDRHCPSPGVVALGQRGGEQAEVDSSGSETVDVKDIQTQSSATITPPGFVHFTADEKEQLNRLLDRYAVENVGAAELVSHHNSSSSPSLLNGSFLKLGVALEKPPVVELSPPPGDNNPKHTHDLNLKPTYTKAATKDTESITTQEGDCDSKTAVQMDSTSNSARVATRDMGTAMTPTPSVEPSRTSTPLREKAQKAAEAAKESTAIADLMLSEEEFQAKTRQEIVALGTQLGKANIAAAWTAREKEKEKDARREHLAAGRRSGDTLDLENLRRDVFASRADAWREAEKAKYISRFEQEQAKIQTWEELEKAKAEAEMRKMELKVERMKSQAHEKMTRKLATMRRHAEEQRLAAETRRGDSAAKVAKKAEILKTNGKITNLLFLSFICT